MLVLASESAARARLLDAAGVEYLRDPARVDESEMRRSMLAEGASGQVMAEALAELKAKRVSLRHPGALCLGADQTLSHAGSTLAKAGGVEEARRELLRLRGGAHELASVAVFAMDGQAIWRHADRALVHVRNFSEAFLDRYLESAGDDALHIVGAYRLEGLGAQLIERVDGDYFTVLGLPLLPVLGFLRTRGVLPT